MVIDVIVILDIMELIVKIISMIVVQIHVYKVHVLMEYKVINAFVLLVGLEKIVTLISMNVHAYHAKMEEFVLI